MKLVQPFILLPFLFSLSLWSATPVPYTGKIDIQGVNYFGEAHFAFSLHDGNGTTHWRNGNQPGETIKVSIRNGRYNVLLGGQGMNSLPPELFLNHDKLFLKVEFDDGDGTGLRHLAPDQLITATPRALVAEISKLSEGVSPGAITRDMLNSEVLTKLDMQAEVADGSITPSKIAANSITTGQLSEQILKYLKPEITTQPQAQTVYADSNVSFSVSAEGKYLTYQWKKNGVSLGGETNATLTLTDANSTLHDGNYSVVVGNDFGSVESGLTEVLVKDGILNGLVGWWRFDEMNGTVVNDSSGRGNNGTLLGSPTWVSGKIGGALSLDGGDYMEVSPRKWNLANVTTVSLWFNLSQNTSGAVTVFSLGQPSSSDEILFWYDDQSMRFFLHKSNSNYARLSSSASFATWRHFSGVIDGGFAQSQMKFYSNGQLVNATYYTKGSPALLSDANDRKLRIGNRVSMQAGFQGLIDDVRIYDRALSAAEVQALYQLGQ